MKVGARVAKIAEAFFNNSDKNVLDNVSNVRYWKGTKSRELIYYSSPILLIENGILSISLCGWKKITTNKRLRSILELRLSNEIINKYIKLAWEAPNERIIIPEYKD